jgi:hypothetical protein
LLVVHLVAPVSDSIISQELRFPGARSNRRQVIPPELIGRIAPTRLEGINLRGVFRFPIERYADQLLPSQIASKTSAAG